jgi:hypothetical protein
LGAREIKLVKDAGRGLCERTGKPEDADPALRSCVIQGCGGSRRSN